MKKEIYVRAIPKTIKLTETYSYEQVISSNSFFGEKEKPSGKIEVTLPYDGHNYFDRKAFQDVVRQVQGNLSHEKEVNALIGYLAMSQHDKTNLNDLLFQSKKYESLPIEIPVLNNEIKLDQLYQDQHRFSLKYAYQPQAPELDPIKLNIQVLDDYISLIGLPFPDKLEELSKENHQNLEYLAKQIKDQVYSGIGGGNLLKGNLILCIQVKLCLPRTFSSDLSPIVKRVSIGWPTITSLNSLNLSVNTIDNQKSITYNSLTRSLEWTDVLMKKETNNSDGEWQNYISQRMLLWIRQPGELYQQPSLEGKVEVEIPGQLLSGLQVRFYSFSEPKIGNLYDLPKLNTRLINNFELFLDEAFQKRTRSILQEMKFDKTIPDADSIRIINNELKFQGFDSQSIKLSDLSLNNDVKELSWIVSGWRSEGIDTMKLWILVSGKEYTIKREAQEGNRKYEAIDKSGNFTIYFLGILPNHHYSLMQKMNSFQKGIRNKFEKLALEK